MADATDTTNPSRRSTLGFFTSAPFAALIASGAVAISADEVLIGLGRQIEARQKIESETFARGPLSDDESHELVSVGSKIARRIALTPASTLEGLKAKAAALSWCYGGDEVSIFDCMDDTTDVRLVTSILRDLAALA